MRRGRPHRLPPAPGRIRHRFLHKTLRGADIDKQAPPCWRQCRSFPAAWQDWWPRSRWAAPATGTTARPAHCACVRAGLPAPKAAPARPVSCPALRLHGPAGRTPARRRLPEGRTAPAGLYGAACAEAWRYPLFLVKLRRLASEFDAFSITHAVRIGKPEGSIFFV